tara:strand:+ start:957 stop:2018 length:1062 start_codon:yes stop_codon:yes gene_type:complete
LSKKIIAYNSYTINKPITGVGRYTQMLSYLDDKKIYKVGLCFNKFHCWDNGFNEVLSSNIYSKIPKLFWNYFSKNLRNKFEFLHSPFPSLPLFRSKKSIITIHDLIFLTNPEWYSRSELIFIKNSLKYALKNSNYIICVSESTKNQLIYHFPKVKNKIKVIHNCFPPDFKIESIKNYLPEKSSRLQSIKNHKYLVCPSNRHPRKNLENTINGFINSKFKKAGYKLILTGLNENNFSSRHKFIIDLGYLSDQDYFFLIKNSNGIVYFPYKEGFGLPILDAMMFDKNIYVSKLPVFSEILSNHSMLEEFDNQHSISDYLDEMYIKSENDISYDKKNFSFKNFQKRHFELYNKIFR